MLRYNLRRECGTKQLLLSNIRSTIRKDKIQTEKNNMVRKDETNENRYTLRTQYIYFATS